MNERLIQLGRRGQRAAIAVCAALLLVTGAALRGVVFESPALSAQSASTPALGRAVAGGRDSYADVVNIAAPAVVTIRTEGKVKASPTDFEGDDQGGSGSMDPEDLFRRFFGQFQERQPQSRPRAPRGFNAPRSFKQSALGSGVVVTTDGYILTNNHVVEGADVVRVDLTDGRTLTAKVVGTDKPSDLALLKVDASNLRVLTLGNSDAVQVGDVVLAVGNPLGVGQTVTMGIVSAKGRTNGAGDGGYQDFLQTDAPINHGNSGGALVNTRGELVGINSQILSNSDGNIGIGFAIPANMARHVMDELKSGGKVRRAQLGVTVQPVTSEMAESLGLKQVSGAIVASVAPGSAAERAGIVQGDVITSFNGAAVRDTNTLRNHVAETLPGSSAAVTVLRNGGEKTLTVKLGEAEIGKSARHDEAAPGGDASALGVSVGPLTPEAAARVGAAKNVHGVVVEEVDPEGRAADAGLQPGDIIEQVNRQPLQSVDELRTAVKTAGGKPVLLLIHREGRDIFVTVRPAEAS
jgi:serine protease Do